MEYEIKITGGGKPYQLVEALIGVANSIQEAIHNEQHTCAILDGAEWEDSTLFTEIKST